LRKTAARADAFLIRRVAIFSGAAGRAERAESIEDQDFSNPEPAIGRKVLHQSAMQI
jgi:hypothetical protein